MDLLAAECGQGDEAADFDDPKTPEQAQALARERQAVDALVSVMAGRGLVPPAGSGLGLRDYVVTTSGGSPDVAPDRQSTRLNSSHSCAYRMPSSARKKKTTRPSPQTITK